MGSSVAGVGGVILVPTCELCQQVGSSGWAAAAVVLVVAVPEQTLVA